MNAFPPLKLTDDILELPESNVISLKDNVIPLNDTVPFPTADAVAELAQPKRKYTKRAKTGRKRGRPRKEFAKTNAPSTHAPVSIGVTSFAESGVPAASPDAAGRSLDRQGLYVASMFKPGNGPRPDLTPRHRPTWWQRFAPFGDLGGMDPFDGDRPARILTRGERAAVILIPFLCLLIGAYAAIYWW